MRIAIGSDHAGFDYKQKIHALQVVRISLETPFEGGRHLRRIKLIDASPDW